MLSSELYPLTENCRDFGVSVSSGTRKHPPDRNVSCANSQNGRTNVESRGCKEDRLGGKTEKDTRAEPHNAEAHRKRVCFHNHQAVHLDTASGVMQWTVANRNSCNCTGPSLGVWMGYWSKCQKVKIRGGIDRTRNCIYTFRDRSDHFKPPV